MGCHRLNAQINIGFQAALDLITMTIFTDDGQYYIKGILSFFPSGLTMIIPVTVPSNDADIKASPGRHAIFICGNDHRWRLQRE
jgi:hypothetical protein